jgi:pimeloyl-ACP methyl ester carboxylesterase
VPYLDVPGGRIAYDDEGSGPLVLCTPGVGDVRAVYRFLTPHLINAGYRVVTMDIRGHGESSVGWPAYTPAAVGQDMLALLRHLDAGPAVVIGESFAAESAVLAAAEAPALIAGLVLAGAAVRQPPPSRFMKIATAAVLTSPRLWTVFYRSLYRTRQPDDLATYRRALRRNLAEPGRMAALRGFTYAEKVGNSGALPRVSCPVLVLMGTKDPDFTDPAAEARWIAEQLSGKAAMVDGAGHYPPAEYPAESAAAVLPFLATTLPGTRVAP